MKKILIAGLSFAAWTVIAAEFEVELPTVNLKKEWNEGTLTDKNYTSGTIGKKEYPKVWSYWFIKSGTTPETFQLEPLKAIPKDSKSALRWKDNTIMASEYYGDGFRFPALLNGYFVLRETRNGLGGAYSFTNPFTEKIKVIIEGNFNHLAGMDVFIYSKTRNGKITKIGDNKNPDAIQQTSNKFPDGSTRIRNYLKLQIEQTLEAGDSIFFAVKDPKGVAGKYVKEAKTIFRTNDNWGKTWNPIFIIDKD